MQVLHEVMEQLEQSCSTEAALLQFTPPNVEELIAAIRALPLEERAELHGKIDRIHVMMGNHLLLYREELERLGAGVTNIPAHRAQDGTYRRVVAVIPVNAE
jgi:phage-related protein